MKRWIFAIMAVWAVAAVAATTDYAGGMVRSQGRAWSQDKAWDYVSGLVAKSILRYTEQYPDSALSATAYDWCKRYADNSLYADGQFINFKKGSLDNIASGKVLLDIYRHEEAIERGRGAKYKAAADYLYNYLRHEYPRIADAEATGCFIHKDRYPYQMWLDGQFMGPAFYAEYLSMFAPDDTEGWADIANQFITIHCHTYDADKHLNYHGWSSRPNDPNSFWANKTGAHKGCSREFWGRGMGWYFAALADVLWLMPQDHPDFAELEEIYREVAQGLKEHQDPESGVWYQLLQYDDSYVSPGGRSNYLEASASCMFVYAYIKGLRLRLIEKSDYLEVVERAYQGLLDTFITTDTKGQLSIHKICRSAGLGPASDPSRDGTAAYYLDGRDVEVVSNEGKGIGSFILASLEYQLLHHEGRSGLHSISMTINGDPRTSRALSWMTDTSTTEGELQIVEGESSDFERPDIRVVAESRLTPGLGYANPSNKVAGLEPNLVVSYCSHRALVDCLKPRTTYSYRVGSPGQWSPIGQFTTAGDTDQYDYIYITDTQARDSAMFEVTQRTVHAAVEMCPNAEFIICTGDLVDSQGDYCSEWEWEEWIRTSQDVWMRYPLAATVGNHDINPDKNFEWHFYNDNTYNSTTAVPTAIDGTVYSFELGGALYLVINYEDYATEGYLEALRQWMRCEVERSQARWRVVCMHRAMFTGAKSHQDSGASRMIRKKMLPVFAELGIDLALQGHDHIYEVIGPVDNLTMTVVPGAVSGVESTTPSTDASNRNGRSGGVYDVSEGTLYFLNNSAGMKKYEPRTREEMDAAYPAHQVQDYWSLFTGRLGQDGKPTFTHVKVSEASLTLATYSVDEQGETSVYDTFEVVKRLPGSIVSVDGGHISLQRQGSWLNVDGMNARRVGVYSTAGTLVAASECSSVDIAGLAPGIYIVRANDARTARTFKILID